MTPNVKVFIMLVVLAAVSMAAAFFDLRLALGITAGIMLFALNYLAITFTVKGIVSGDGQPVQKAVSVVMIYTGKILVIGAAVFAVIKFREVISIKGFLAGVFAATAAVLIGHTLLFKEKKKTI